MAKNLNLKEKQELYEKLNIEMVSKREELKGIELLVDECVDEISSESSKSYFADDEFCLFLRLKHPLFLF